QLYKNDGQGNFTPLNLGTDTKATLSVAWGDMDGDGDPDLAAGNDDQVNQLYKNDGQGNFTPLNLGTDTKATLSVAWGDMDGDGDLDLAVGNNGPVNNNNSLGPFQVNQLYKNDGQGNLTPLNLGTDTKATRSVAWGDMDGDGDLDLAIGNEDQVNQVYVNTRQGRVALTNNLNAISPARPYTSTANFYTQPDILSQRTIPLTYTLFDPEGEPVGHIETKYSPNGGGQWFPAVATTNTITTNLKTGRWFNKAVLSPSQAIPDNTGSSLNASLVVTDSNADIAQVEVWLSITHTNNAHLAVALRSPAGIAVPLFTTGQATGTNLSGTRFAANVTTTLIVSGTAPYTRTYQPKGSLSDFIGQPLSGTWTLVITDSAGGGSGGLAGWGLRLKTPAVSHVYTWDTFTSDFFGQSDNVVIRMVAHSQPPSNTITISGTYRYPNTTPGPIQRPYASAQSYPFRVRGTQVQVISGTKGISGAIVYRLPAGQETGGLALGQIISQPFTTNSQGYLTGRGKIAISDTLVALVPATPISWAGIFSDDVELYYTNISPSVTGLDAFPITQSGVQQITVSAHKPLLLFNLDVSLEWDARNDSAYLARLEADLQRASELLFDVTNGQAALGRINIYHDRERWLQAHLRIYGSNQLRPSAVQGGIVQTDTVDITAREPLTYSSGQINMGAIWNRFGDAGSENLAEDWSRALVHELGHYLLFLDDHYLGWENDLIVPLESCYGLMADAYRDDYTELHPGTQQLPQPGSWDNRCTNTLANTATGRNDWQTIKEFYPLVAPASPADNAGPHSLPLVVTRITEVRSSAPSETIAVPNFYLRKQGGQPFFASASAQTFLIRPDHRLVDLGGALEDKIIAYGAQPQDKLCLFDAQQQMQGCRLVGSTGNNILTVKPVVDWQPDIIVTPITSSTLTISVTNLANSYNLEAWLYPLNDVITTALPLTWQNGVYGGIRNNLDTLDYLPYEGYIRVSETTSGLEAIVGYTFGGSPANQHKANQHKANQHKANQHKANQHKANQHKAPVFSTNRQAALYGRNLDNLAADQFFALQSTPVISPQLPWATMVGQGYHLLASPNTPATAFNGTSISFNYLGRDVPPGADNEAWLRIYYYDGAAAWQPLETRLDTRNNNAVAETRGPGLYALMASLETPLYSLGWNNISYPIQETRPVSLALSSIAGAYSTVYRQVLTDTVDPWKIYDVAAPPWVNDLNNLEFPQAYWVNITKAITLYLNPAAQGLTAAGNGFGPPATYYGAVISGTTITSPLRWAWRLRLRSMVMCVVRPKP
ncbi:MAG: hypothetical protein GY934_13565, partial [Gammaproteobacteria bacterium]|nr:hypothetical protein [Gammaproteobacteria bacterium]